MNRKGQWARAMARERRSQDRRDRLEVTKEYLKKGHTADEIAFQLGISGNTVRQYIKEVKPLAEEEVYFEKLQVKLDLLNKEMKENELEKTNGKQRINKFVNNSVEILEIYYRQIESLERRGIEKPFTDVMKNTVREIYSSLYTSCLVSFESTFNSPANYQALDTNEIAKFNEFFKPWKRRIESKHDQIAAEDYHLFTKRLEIQEKMTNSKNFLETLKLIEKEVELENNLSKLELPVDKILNKLDIDKKEIEKSNNLSDGWLSLCMIINLVIPGLGTLIGSRRTKKQNSLIQLGVVTIGIIIPYVGFLLIVIAWSLALVDVIKEVEYSKLL